MTTAIPAEVLPAHPATVEEFLTRKLPPKEALIEGLMFRRDIIAFGGRRRHGKTTLIANLIVALALGMLDFLGYKIPESARVLVYFLEDDDTELQIKLRRILDGRSTEGRLVIRTKTDFRKLSIAIDAENPAFQARVKADVQKHKPDLIVFDNLAHLIGAEYGESKRIHKLMKLIFDLAGDDNAAVLIAAHPRKRTGDPKDFKSLREDQEGFFEEIMGSSHFVNSCGSLWGIERNSENKTYFVGGAQRFTGEQSWVTLEKGEDDWLHIVSDLSENAVNVLTTKQRQSAWGLLPDGPITYSQGEKAVKPAMSSSSSFNYFWRDLIRNRLLVECQPPGKGYRKEKVQVPAFL